MLSQLWPLSESMYLITLKNLVCQLVASESYLNQLMVFSLLGHLIMVKYSEFKYLRFTLKLEEIQGPPGPSCKFLQKKHGKNIPYLEGERGGGVLRALIKKTYPVLFSHSQGPLVSVCLFSTRQNFNFE